LWIELWKQLTTTLRRPPNTPPQKKRKAIEVVFSFWFLLGFAFSSLKSHKF